MENKTVKELREIAKEREMKHYCKMRKADLMRALQPVVVRPVPAPRPMVQKPVPAPRPAPRPVPAHDTRVRIVPSTRVRLFPSTRVRIVSRPIPVVQRPVPAPRPAPRPVPAQRPVPAPRPITSLTSAARSVSSYVVDRYNDIVHWIEPYIPEAVKKKVSDTGIEINKKNRVSQIVRIQNSEPATSVVKKTPTEPESSVVKPATSVVKPIQLKIEFKLVNQAIKKSTRQFLYEVRNEERDVSSFLNRAKEGPIKILRENRNNKVHIVLTCQMECASMLTGEVITRIVPFRSNTGILLEATELEKFHNRAKEVILENMIKYNKMGSNCLFSAIVKMDINMIDYNPLRQGLISLLI